ncbi:MAG: putative 2-aminoethylphosphonate ABC transporter substrate-binding protein [Betaproteobacteria bacterium]|nr:putative 2-aminoethylphosphonate ABC transporter substrate-binding protein [Betaproteobacteria bacterium]
MKSMFRRKPGLSAIAVAAALAATGALAQKTELLVYTALETDQLKAYTESFQKTNPNIDLKFVRDSTGVITAKILAEKANPQADVILGVSASSLEIFKAEGMLAPYAPAGFDKLTATFSDTSRPPSWVGMDVYAAVVCYNTVEGQKKGIPKPESWADLAKPVYKGQVTMPNPASSGTGYLSVSGWLQVMGEAGGWKYMDQLHENVAQYTHSGSKPCRQSGAGEFVVGISFDFRGNDVKQKGAPVDLVFPKEGLGWDVESSGIVKATKKMDAAKKLMDWVATKEANMAYAKNFALVAHPEVKPSLPHIPADLDKKIIKNNFAFAASNREKILAEWQKRYGAKSEK